MSIKQAQYRLLRELAENIDSETIPSSAALDVLYEDAMKQARWENHGELWDEAAQAVLRARTLVEKAENAEKAS